MVSTHALTPFSLIFCVCGWLVYLTLSFFVGSVYDLEVAALEKEQGKVCEKTYNYPTDK